MLVRGLGCALALVFVSSSGCRPPPPKRTVAVSLTAERFTGTNGVEVFTIPDREAAFVGFHVRYAAGSLEDPPGKEGLAHLVEHLMFSRSLKFGDRLITVGTRLDEIAITGNAFTRRDHTHYWSVVPPRHLEELFAIETVRMAGGCSAIEPEVFEREREVVRNEIRQRSAGDLGKIRPKLLAGAYGDHPYARPVGGTDASVRAITLDDVCQFIEEHYAPAKARFIVTGPVETATVRAAAAKWLGRIPPRASRPRPGLPPLKVKARAVEITADVEVPRLLVAWAVPAEHRAYPMIDRVVSALEGRMAFFASTYKLGSEVDAEIWGGSRAPLLVLQVKLPDPGKLDEAWDAVRRAAGSVEFGLPKDELSSTKVDMFDARSWAIENLLASFETVVNRGVAFADLAERSGGTRFLVEEVEAIDKLDVDELRSMGSSMVDPDRAFRMFIRPSGRRDPRAAGAVMNHSSNRWKIAVDPAEAGRPLPLPDLGAYPAIEELRLDNGLRVIFCQAGTLPLVRARMVFAAGAAHNPESLPGLAQLAGAFSGKSVGDDVTREQIRSLNTRIDVQVASLVSYDEYGFAQQAVERARVEIARTLREPRLAARSRYRRALAKGLFGAEHPYTRGEVMDPQVLKKIDQTTLRRFAGRFYGAANTTLIIVGRFDAKLMREYLERQLGHRPRGERARPTPLSVHRVGGPRVVAASSSRAGQLEIEVAFPGPTGVDARYPARLVLASMISARLQALREERGITYGAQAGYTPRVGPGIWRLVAQVDPSRATESVLAIRQVLAVLRAAGASGLAADFVAGRRQVARQLLLERSLPDMVIEQIDFAVRFGLPLDYRARLVEAVAAVRLEDVAELIATELSPGNQVLGVFGDAGAIEAAKIGAARAIELETEAETVTETETETGTEAGTEAETGAEAEPVTSP